MSCYLMQFLNEYIKQAAHSFLIQILLNSRSTACVLIKHRVGTTRKNERQTVKDVRPTFFYGRYAISNKKKTKNPWSLNQTKIRMFHC